jgi:hypothetical protein
MSFAENIHPHPDDLRQLPTLQVRTPAGEGEEWQAECREHGIDYVLELKLERTHCRYWLITKYVAQQGSGLYGWQAGHVLRESLEPNEHGEHEEWAYGPENVGCLQRQEYLNALIRERQRLEQDGTPEEYDAVCKDIEFVVKSSPPE